MSRWFYSTLFLMLVVCVQITAALPPASHGTALVSLSTALQGMHTMTAEFAQAVRDETGELLQQSHGHMAWQRPDHFKWSVIAPNQQLMVADGHWLWVYTPNLSQVTKQAFSNQAGTPVALLAGSASGIDRQFYVSMRRESDTVIYALQPKDAQAPFSDIELTIKKGTLTSMRFKDQLNQITTFRFSSVATGEVLPASLFEFSPPPHVTVINQI